MASHYVGTQCVTSGSTIGTVWARERLFARVGPQMGIEVVGLDGPEVAVGAAVRFIPRVRLDVFLHVGDVYRTVTALRATPFHETVGIDASDVQRRPRQTTTAAAAGGRGLRASQQTHGRTGV